MFRLSQNKIKQVIVADYPDFKIKTIKSLKSGWDNFVFEINGKYIFRFPKNNDFNLDGEIKVLKYLKGKITTKIPDYKYIGRKIRYVGYAKIMGSSLTIKLLKSLSKSEKKMLARSLARFLFEFHAALPLKKVKEFNIKGGSFKWRVNVINRLLLKKLKDRKLLKLIQDSLRIYLKSKKHQKVIIAYNDLHGENIAYDEKKRKLNGVFDFSDTAVSDINIELSCLFPLDECLNLEVINQYQKLSGRKIDLKIVLADAVIIQASILAIYINKPKARNYKIALDSLKEIALFVDKYTSK